MLRLRSGCEGRLMCAACGRAMVSRRSGLRIGAPDDALAWVRSEITIDGSGHGSPGGVGSWEFNDHHTGFSARCATLHPSDQSRWHRASTASFSTQTKDLRSLAGFGGLYSSVQSPLTFRFTSALYPSIRFRSLPRQSSLPTGPMIQL